MELIKSIKAVHTQQLNLSRNVEVKCERVDDDLVAKNGNNLEDYFDDTVLMMDDVHIVYKKEPIWEDEGSTQKSESLQIIVEYQPALKTELEVEIGNWGDKLAPSVIHKNYECYSCKLAIESFRMLRKYLQKHRLNNLHQFKCKHCTKNFHDKRKLAKHIRIHTNGRPQTCAICMRKCSTNIDLVAHMRVHTNEKPCDVCSKTFNMRGDLNCHKRTHTGDRPYKCTIFSKRFIRKSHLNRHSRLHTGATPYSCDVCSRSQKYSSTSSLHN